jgi:hypothetical protein
MVAHLGHASIIHAAAWIPGVLWVMEELACTLRVRWVLVGALVLSQRILAGRPQIALYGLTLTIAYVAFRGFDVCRRVAFFAMSPFVLVRAVILSAVQTLSTVAVVWVTEDRDTILQVQTINRQPSFLVQGDFYFPGWAAVVNDRPVPILWTNHVQRGVLLPAGQNLVRFGFRPSSLYAGIGISASGLLIVCMLAVVGRMRGVL